MPSPFVTCPTTAVCGAAVPRGQPAQVCGGHQHFRDGDGPAVRTAFERCTAGVAAQQRSSISAELCSFITNIRQALQLTAILLRAPCRFEGVEREPAPSDDAEGGSEGEPPADDSAPASRVRQRYEKAAREKQRTAEHESPARRKEQASQTQVWGRSGAEQLCSSAPNKALRLPASECAGLPASLNRHDPAPLSLCRNMPPQRRWPKPTSAAPFPPSLCPTSGGGCIAGVQRQGVKRGHNKLCLRGVHGAHAACFLFKRPAPLRPTPRLACCPVPCSVYLDQVERDLLSALDRLMREETWQPLSADLPVRLGNQDGIGTPLGGCARGESVHLCRGLLGAACRTGQHA